MQFIYTALSHPVIKRVVVYSLLAIALFGIFYLVKDKGLLWYYQNNPDVLMKEIPFYSVIKEHEPNLYQQIEQDVSLALQSEQTPIELKLKVKGYLDQLISQRVPLSSNEAVIAYTQVTLSEMRALKEHGYGVCHRFLYPNENPLELDKYLHQDLMDRDLAALTSVIRSSYEAPNPTPEAKDVQLYLSHVYTQLSQNYSHEEIQVLAEPLDARTDKDKVCELTIALFEEILKLPTQQSGETLRFIVSQNQAP